MINKLSTYCHNCGNAFGKNDLYCSYCGEQRKEGKFEPRHNRSAMLYGPPYSVKYHCAQCNVTFKVSGLGSPRTRYCPECGKVCDCSKEGLQGRDAYVREAVRPRESNDEELKDLIEEIKREHKKD